jgi:hypothetical protein
MHTNRKSTSSPKRNEPCPCGSGEVYGRCCAGRKVIWSKGPDGTWTQGIPLSREALKILRAQEREFVELFGRKPGGNDPVFFEMDALYSDELIQEEMDEILSLAGISPDIAYASQKTGRIVTAHNNSLLTGRDLREWREAIEEYHRKKNSPRTESPNEWHKRLITLIVSEFDRCMVVMGLVLRRGGPVRVSHTHELAAGHTFFCLTKAIKTMQAIRLLTDKRFGEDALILIRSILEAYLHAAYLLAHPEKAADLVTARVGLVNGTHEYLVTSKGRVDYSRIVEKATGRTFEGRITFKTMANKSAISEDSSVYEVLYEFLSGHTHPNFAHATTYVSIERSSFEHTGRAMFLEARALGFVVGCMFLHVLFQSGYLSNDMNRDLRVYLCRTRRKLLALFKNGFPAALVVPLRTRMKRLPSKGELRRKRH